MEYDVSEQAVEQEIHLAEYWALVVKRRRLIAICVVAALMVGAALSLISPATYRATTVLDVEKDKGNPTDIDPSPTAFSYDPEFLPTQTRLMRSREVAQRVAERLNLLQNSEFAGPNPSGADAAEVSKQLLPRAAAAIQERVDVAPVR